MQKFAELAHVLLHSIVYGASSSKSMAVRAAAKIEHKKVVLVSDVKYLIFKSQLFGYFYPDLGSRMNYEESSTSMQVIRPSPCQRLANTRQRVVCV